MAGRRCCNGVRWKQSTQRFEAHLFSGTARQRRELLDGKWRPHKYVRFTIRERGKTRTIDAPHIKDRQVHKALTRGCLIPLFGPSMIYDNGASIKGKGLHFCFRRLKEQLRWHYQRYGRSGYVLLMDFSRFFPSAPHETLYQRHRRLILDEDLRVLDGTSLIPGKTDYTQRELELLTNRWSSQYTLYRKSAQDSSGAPVTVLILLPSYSDADFQAAFDKAGRLWLLTIPLYCGVTLLFIVLLNRHFRRPLTRLGDAIRRLGAGEPVSAAACGGPEEIQELGRSFDAMARQLAESQAETRRLEEQRIKMLTDLSHDLKTPITVISGYISAVRDGKVSEEDLPQYLEIIGKKADALTELINSFYEYSKTEHPDFRLELVETDLCEFLREYLADKFNEIDLAGFSLEVDIPETLRLPCRLDPFQMRRALDNILGNSLRHNRLGTRIRVSLIQTGSAVLLRLADNGNGIPEALRKDLFTPFTVGDQSRSKGGSGLGLAISLKIIEAHGWTLRLSPETGAGGTVFEILIPR